MPQPLCHSDNFAVADLSPRKFTTLNYFDESLCAGTSYVVHFRTFQVYGRVKTKSRFAAFSCAPFSVPDFVESTVMETWESRRSTGTRRRSQVLHRSCIESLIRRPSQRVQLLIEDFLLRLLGNEFERLIDKHDVPSMDCNHLTRRFPRGELILSFCSPDAKGFLIGVMERSSRIRHKSVCSKRYTCRRHPSHSSGRSRRVGLAARVEALTPKRLRSAGTRDERSFPTAA